MMKKFYGYTLALIACLCVLSGCIRENVDDCETPVEVNFLYFGNGIVDIFPDRVDSVLMYVYRLPSNSVEQTIRLHKSDLLERQGVKLRLTPGDYRLICWGNAGDGSHVIPEGGDARIMTLDYHNGLVPEQIEELYHGAIELNVPRTLRAVEEDMVYRASYIKMKVELLDFANTGLVSVMAKSARQQNGGSGAIVNLAHADHSAHIDFYNTPSADEFTDYVPVLQTHPDEPGSYIVEYLVPRFGNDTGSDLAVTRRSDGSLLYSRPLSEIMQMLDIVLDDRNEQEVHVRLRLMRSEGAVGINVIGWNDEIVYPEFD